MIGWMIAPASSVAIDSLTQSSNQVTRAFSYWRKTRCFELDRLDQVYNFTIDKNNNKKKGENSPSRSGFAQSFSIETIGSVTAKNEIIGVRFDDHMWIVAAVYRASPRRQLH